MPILLPDELTQIEIDHINQFTKNYEIRVKLFKDETSTEYSLTAVADGDFNTTTGVYTISPERIWLKKIYAVRPLGFQEYNIFQLEYEDFDGNWIVAKTEPVTSDHFYFLKVPIYAKKFRVKFYIDIDLNDTKPPESGFDPKLYSDTWQEIQAHLGTEIRIENAVGNLDGNIKLPFVSLSLNNVDGIWSKNNATLSLPVYFLDRDNGEDISSSSSTVIKKAGIRIVIEMKFYGPNWEGSDWILLSTFHARKWTSNNVSGEAGWVAKTLYKTPIIEGATLGSILRDYIIRDEGDMLIQLNGGIDDEVITVNNEFAGEADLEPILPTKLLDGKKIHCHTQDDRYIYYALKNVSGADTNAGGYIEVRRVTKSGDNDEFIGKIYAVPNDSFFISAADQPFFGAQYSGLHPSLNNNNQCQRLIRSVFDMVINGEDLYLSCLSIIKGIYSPIGAFTVWHAESFILKLDKNGAGWSVIVGSEAEESNGSNVVTETPSSYTYANKYSLGYHGILNLPIHVDPYDRITGGNHYPVIRSLMLFDDAGTKRLLFVKERQRDGTKSPPMSEFWKIDLDFSSPVKVGDTGTTIRIEALLSFSDIVQYVHFTNWIGGTGAETSKELGVISRDIATGDFFIATYGRAELAERFLSMSFFSTGIFSSGNAFDDGTGYNVDAENVASDGIKEKYQCLFVLDGFSIIHFQHATRNDFISFSVPEILIGGVPINFNTVKYAEEYLSNDLLVTTGWVLDLRTGVFVLRQALTSTDPLPIIANYDFIRSIMFYSGDSISRLNQNALGLISQSMTGNLYIDECECIRKLPFIESQQIPLNHVINPYNLETEDLGEYLDTTGFNGMDITKGAGATDKVMAFQFTPTFDGKLDFIRMAVKLVKVGALSGVNDVPIDIDFYLSGDVGVGCDLSSTDGSLITDAPESALIKDLSEGVEQIYISYAKIDAITDESEFFWLSFDLSGANESVVKGRNYAIIMRTPVTGDNANYMILTKEVADANGLHASNESLPAGDDPTTIIEANYRTTNNTETGIALLYVEVKKTSVELKSVDIIDSLNPNISSGFTSIIGGLNSTISVISDDFSTTYIKGTDYNITYSGGKFFIDFPSGGALSDRTKSIIVRWYESKNDLLSITDQKVTGEEKEIVSEFAEFGDETTFLRTIIRGQKLRPADTNVKIDKAFELFPGILLDLEQENTQTKKIETNTINQWNDVKNTYEPSSDLEGESSKFVFEFNDPFIIGTTAYSVRVAKGHSNGADPADPLESGTITTTFIQDVPKFYRIDVTAFLDTEYHVMLKPEQYREWRLANKEDFPDMTVFNVVGVKPTDVEDVFTKDHFFLKRMNQSFGERNANWIAYTSEERVFYINKDGIIIRDDAFTGISIFNPIPSAYIDKTIFVLIEPIDFVSAPMFEAHSEVGKDGFDSDMLSAVKQFMASKIDRAIINAKGVNVVYSNFDTKKKFLKIVVIGFPINNITSIREERRKEGFEHADAKTMEINNDLIQTQAIASRKSAFLMDFWGKERVNFRKEIVMDPRIRPGGVTKVTSERENLSNDLFYLGTVNLLLSTQGGFKQTLSSFLQI